MLITRRTCSTWSLAAVVALMGLGFSGCGGENPREALWDQALTVDALHQSVIQSMDDPQMRQPAHMETADRLESLLRRYPEAPDGLRQVLADIAEGERRIGDGDATGAAARELMEQHEEYWSYLRDRELPPEYR